ncbi:hypothetical protein BDD12DRAFT_18499 [Trichophaea hybrida]|nr:hypothetical protein BDD12DRAFT_18499 [Trichophaea hybrida]
MQTRSGIYRPSPIDTYIHILISDLNTSSYIRFLRHRRVIPPPTPTCMRNYLQLTYAWGKRVKKYLFHIRSDRELHLPWPDTDAHPQHQLQRSQLASHLHDHPPHVSFVQPIIVLSDAGSPARHFRTGEMCECTHVGMWGTTDGPRSGDVRGRQKLCTHETQNMPCCHITTKFYLDPSAWFQYYYFLKFNGAVAPSYILGRGETRYIAHTHTPTFLHPIPTLFYYYMPPPPTTTTTTTTATITAQLNNPHPPFPPDRGWCCVRGPFHPPSPPPPQCQPPP